MKNKTTSSVESYISPFEKIKHVSDQGSEYWSAREFAEVLEYTQYRNFEKVIEKAKLACFNSGYPMGDHFADVSKMVPLGSSAQREVAHCLLSRYACYLCIQSSVPSKDIVAKGQTYFATQTRIREIEEAELEEERRVQYATKFASIIRSWRMLPGMQVLWMLKITLYFRTMDTKDSMEA